MKTMMVATKYRHKGGAEGLRVGAETKWVYNGPGRRGLFNWDDGPKIVGCLNLYDCGDYPEFFEGIEWMEVPVKKERTSLLSELGYLFHMICGG